MKNKLSDLNNHLFAQLERENAELKAQVEQLRTAGSELRLPLNTDNMICGRSRRAVMKWDQAADSTPAQCLAEIKAEAVIDAIDAYKNNLMTFDFNTAIRVTDLIKYANQLRQLTKVGE